MNGPRVAAAEDEAYNKMTRALLEEKGFDPEDVDKICDISGWGSVTPMTYYSRRGNVTMIRYLIARGADCRAVALNGLWFPMFATAVGGHLEIMKLLSQDGGAHDDIRRVTTRNGISPLRVAFDNGYSEIVYWLIQNGALASGDDVEGGGIDDAIMRRDLRQEFRQEGGHAWREDKREAILLWAQYAVARHENVVQLLLTGTIVRSNNQEPSPLVTFKGTSGILELIARFVAGTQQQLRSRRQLLDLLSTFIDDTPFVEEDDEWDY